MKRRLDIAMTLVGSPRIIFLDEPTTGLDPRARHTMWGIIRDLVSEGVTVFLTTQYLEEAERLAETIAVLDGGRIIAQGTAAELKQRVAAQRLDLTAASEAAYDDLTCHFGDRASHRDHASLTLGVPTDGGAAEIRALLDMADPGRTLVASFAVRTASLDDVFLILTHHGTAKETAHV
jgi:ABC-2 type transport system ATP-binding protein